MGESLQHNLPIWTEEKTEQLVSGHAHIEYEVAYPIEKTQIILEFF